MPERKTPDAYGLKVWRGYLETAERIRSAVAAQLQADSNLGFGDYQVLLALKEATNNELKSSELAEKVGWERSRLSHHLGRMEKRELISRHECPGNGRNVLIRATETGLGVLRSSHPKHMRAIHNLFTGQLSKPQLAAIQEANAVLESVLNAQSCSETQDSK